MPCILIGIPCTNIIPVILDVVVLHVLGADEEGVLGIILLPGQPELSQNLQIQGCLLLRLIQFDVIYIEIFISYRAL